MSEAMNEIEQRDYEEALHAAESKDKQPFEVNSLSTASWAMNMLRGLEAKDKDIDANKDEQINPYQMRIDEVNDWADSEHDRNEQHKEYFKGLLSDYLFKLRQKDPKARISTPSGTVSTRKSPKGIETDDAKVMESFKKQGIDDFIKTKVSLSKSDLNKHGEFVNGKFVITDGDYQGSIIEGVREKPIFEKTTFKIKED